MPRGHVINPECPISLKNQHIVSFDSARQTRWEASRWRLRQGEPMHVTFPVHITLVPPDYFYKPCYFAAISTDGRLVCLARLDRNGLPMAQRSFTVIVLFEFVLDVE